MKKKMKYKDVEKLRVVFERMCRTTRAKPRIEMAKRVIYLKGVLSALESTKEESDKIKAYRNKQAGLYKKHGKRVVDTCGQNGGKSSSYEIKDWDSLREDMSNLSDEYSDAIEEDEKRVVLLGEMFNETVELDIEPVRNEWCGDLIDGIDLIFLIENDLITGFRKEQE